MKTILLATDFSNQSRDAVRYGYQLAQQVRADVVLCNAIIVPAEVPQGGMMTWQVEEYDMLKEDSADELRRFKNELEQSLPATGYRPKVSCMSEAGRVSDVVTSIALAQNMDMIVIGGHVGGSLSSLLLGNHVKMLIDSTPKPLLLVSPDTAFKPIKKIAFATEFKKLEQDLKHIYELIGWAKMLNAEILLVHITNDKQDEQLLHKSLSDCLLDLSNKANYPNIYYRLINNNQVEAGLEWLCGHGQIDILAMVHQPRNLFAEVLDHSHTKKMAGASQLPLLVFPA